MGTPEENMRRNIELSRLARPKIRKLARQGKAMDTAFKTVRAAVFPEATPDEIAVMRTMFFAGAAELSAMQMYGISEGDTEAPEDMVLYGQMMEEIELRHGATIQLAAVRFDDKDPH